MISQIVFQANPRVVVELRAAQGGEDRIAVIQIQTSPSQFVRYVITFYVCALFLCEHFRKMTRAGDEEDRILAVSQ